MFNRKKKAQQLQQLRTQQEETFAAAIQKASAMTNPGERIIELQAIKKQIDFYLVGEARKISKKANAVEKKLSNGGDLLFYAGLGASLVLSGPLVWVPAAVGGVGYLGSEIAGSLRSDAIKKKQTKALSGHAENMKGLQALVDKLTSETIEKDMEAIQASPITYLRVRNIPGLAAQFSAAAAKQAEAAQENKKRVLKPQDGKFKGILRKEPKA